MIEREIVYFGRRRVLCCDGRCEKAWGIDTRPRLELDLEDLDDFAWLSDGELGEAPVDPGTYEGSCGKPAPTEKLESKWCARQCERSGVFAPGEDVELRDLGRRFYNMAPHVRDGARGPGGPGSRKQANSTQR